MSEAAAEAQRAFARLQAFDPNFDERAELRSSGVSGNRINALYGRQWPVLVLAIIEHLEGVSDEELLLEGRITKDQMFELWNTVPENIFDESGADDDADDEAVRALGIESALEGYLRKRFDATPGTMVAQFKLTPTTVSAGVWGANWLMANRHRLSPKRQRLTDELMVSIARTIAL